MPGARASVPGMGLRTPLAAPLTRAVCRSPPWCPLPGCFHASEQAVLAVVRPLHSRPGAPRFNAFHPDTRKPMHRECGFIRLEPDTNKVAFVSAQNTGTSAAARGPCSRTFCRGQLGRRHDPGKRAGACLQSLGVPGRRGHGGDSRELAGFLSTLVAAVTAARPATWHTGSVGSGPRGESQGGSLSRESSVCGKSAVSAEGSHPKVGHQLESIQNPPVT